MLVSLYPALPTASEEDAPLSYGVLRAIERLRQVDHSITHTLDGQNHKCQIWLEGSIQQTCPTLFQQERLGER